MWLVQEDMFSPGTYGCTSWSSYIVAVISGFILASLPFVSRFYWIAPQLPLHPHVYFCHLVLLQPRETSLILSGVITHTVTNSIQTQQEFTVHSNLINIQRLVSAL